MSRAPEFLGCLDPPIQQYTSQQFSRSLVTGQRSDPSQAGVGPKCRRIRRETAYWYMTYWNTAYWDTTYWDTFHLDTHVTRDTAYWDVLCSRNWFTRPR